MEQRKNDRVCAIVGAGPGNGAAFARRFAADGYRVALLARDAERLRALAAEVPGAFAFACDVADEASVAAAFAAVTASLGPVDVLVYNAGNFVPGSITDVTTADLESSLRVNCTGLLTAAQRVVPSMIERQAGTIVVIGATASRRGAAAALAFATAKSGQRAMAESMARALGPRGVHVAYVVVDGVIDMPRARAWFSDRPDDFFLRPDDIAESVAAVARQKRSAWTFELDLRPFGERW